MAVDARCVYDDELVPALLELGEGFGQYAGLVVVEHGGSFGRPSAIPVACGTLRIEVENAHCLASGLGGDGKANG
jgi:hypothetical protein